MGASISNVEITIKCDRNERFYFGGDVISGTVIIKLPETEEVDGLYLALFTQACYYHESQARDKQISPIRIPLIIHTFLISAPNSGKLKLKSGTHEFPFRIRIPENIPPQIYCNKGISLISHFLQLSLDGAVKNPDRTGSVGIIVYPKINILKDVNRLQEITVHGDQKYVFVSATMERSAFVPGNFIMIKFVVSNPKKYFLKSCHVSLVQTFHVEEVKGKRTIFDSRVPNMSETSSENINELVYVQIPARPLPPSYSYIGGIDRCISVTINYHLAVKIVVRGYFNPDIKLNVPILVGTEPFGEGNVQTDRIVSESTHAQVISNSTANNVNERVGQPDTPMNTDNHLYPTLPPSYDSLYPNDSPSAPALDQMTPEK